MCRFIETIKISNLLIQNLDFHQRRLEKTISKFFPSINKFDLAELIKLPKLDSNKIYKCRIIYSNTIHEISFVEYKRKIIQSVKKVFNNEIEYSFKFENRDLINFLLKNSGADEIIIVKNGFITDTSFSNIIFDDGKSLFTPSRPLLFGTKLDFLMQTNTINQTEIKVNDLKFFKSFYLINSMLDLVEMNKYPIQIIY